MMYSRLKLVAHKKNSGSADRNKQKLIFIPHQTQHLIIEKRRITMKKLLEEGNTELTALREELIRIEAVPAAMEQMENKALLEELRPWLVEFGKLGTRCRKALELLDQYKQSAEDKKFEGFWEGYVSNLMSEKDVEMYRQLGGWLRSSHPLKSA